MNMSKGYGFRPTEEELMGHLRSRTLLGPDYFVQDITDLPGDICKWNPRDLLGCSTVTSSDPVRYFTYPITYKHPKNNSKMVDMATGEGPGRKRKREPAINRATSSGYWKVSGEGLKVKASDSKEEIGIKTRLYFRPSIANKKKSKAKGQDSYQNKTTWVLYVFELIDVDPTKNKYFLGKLMWNQSDPTNNSGSKGETSEQLPSNYLGNDHIPTPEVQLYFHQEPLVEMEVSRDYDWIQNQSSEQTTEFVNSFPAVNYETYPEGRSNQGNFVYDGNEVISNTKPLNLGDYVPYYEVPQVDHTELVPNQPYDNQCEHSIRNVLVDHGETYHEERSNEHNIVAENEGFNLPDNFSPIADVSQMNSFGFDDSYLDVAYFDKLFGVTEASDNNGDGVQNQSSINKQVADEFRNANLIDNDDNQRDHSFRNVLVGHGETYHEERSNEHNTVAENKGFNLPDNFSNHPIADVSQMNSFGIDDSYLDGVYFHELFGVTEASDSNGDGVQNQSSINEQVADEFMNANLIDNDDNQRDHSFRNVIVDHGETYHEERSNEHNIVADNEGFNLPDNFSSYPIADVSQMNSFGFDDSYLDGVYFHELFGVTEASDNNGDGVQNQSSINQQVGDEFRNANLIDNEIPYPDERSQSAAAEVEGSNFPSLGMGHGA